MGYFEVVVFLIVANKCACYIAAELYGVNC